jgi:hypothetical protein
MSSSGDIENQNVPFNKAPQETPTNVVAPWDFLFVTPPVGTPVKPPVGIPVGPVDIPPWRK